MSVVEVVAEIVVVNPRNTSRFAEDVPVDVAIVVASSRTAATSSSISDNDVPAPTMDCNSLNTLIDAEDAVCATIAPDSSRRMSNSDVDVPVVVAIVVDSSRRIAIRSSICDVDVVADDVAESSRSTASCAADRSVLAVIALTTSRNTSIDGVEVAVVAAIIVDSSRSVAVISSI